MKKATGYAAVIRAGLLAAGLVLTVGVAHAAIIDFTGGGTNQNWQNAQNWDGPVPTVGDTARVQNDLTAQVAAADQAADEVHVAYAGGGASGDLIIRAGRTLTVEGVMSVGHNGSAVATGTLLVELGLYEGSASEIILISNAGTDAISGTFADVQLLNNSQGYELTYTGGDGNDLAISASSQIGNTPPAAPADLGVVARDSYAYLRWTANSETDLSSYRIYRSTSSGVYGAPLVTGLTKTEYLDESVINGTTYYYVVTAVDEGNNESAASLEAFGKPKEYVVYSTKKGVGNATMPLQKIRVESLNVGWYYGWSMTKNFEMDPAIEYFPMKHSKWWPSLDRLADVGTFTHMLTWNEPYMGESRDPTPTEAVDGGLYQDIVDAALLYGGPDTRIGSPTFKGTDDWWQLEFMPLAEAANLQIDFITCHRYPNPDRLFTQIRNDCDALWAKYGKPIWVTEFNGADWGQTGNWSMEDTYTTMIELLYYFESTPYVERYAVFAWDATWPAGDPSHIFEVEVDDGGVTNRTATLTPLGNLYAQYRHSDINGPYVNTWYYLHNKSSKKRLRENAGNVALANIFNESTSVEFRLVDAGSGRYYIVNRALEKRLGYNGSSLFWAASTATDSAVQWSVSDDVNGWDYINHVGTGKRLSGNPLALVAAGTTGTSVQWSFVRSPGDYPYEVREAAALAGCAYHADLSGTVPAEMGGSASFSISSGPPWLNMDASGIVSGTPAAADIGSNTWQFVVTDGVTSATGTLYITVQKATIVHVEDFNTPESIPLVTKNPAIFPSPEAVTTVTSNGFWFKAGGVGLQTGALRFARPSSRGGYSSCAIVFDETLFTDGAGTYTLSFDIDNADAQIYVELHDLALGIGTVSVPTAGFLANFETAEGTMPVITAEGGAVASLITNVSYPRGATGTRTIDFEYDGSGDVLLRIGAGRHGASAWWVHQIDNLLIRGPIQTMGYDPTFEEWAIGFGLEGDDALPGADPDGDGRSNFEEFLFGTDPTDPTSRFEVGASMNPEGGFEITFETVEGRIYQVERSFDLSAGDWTPVGTAVEGHGGSETVIDDEISARAFYRVTVQLL